MACGRPPTTAEVLEATCRTASFDDRPRSARSASRARGPRHRLGRHGLGRPAQQRHHRAAASTSRPTPAKTWTAHGSRATSGQIGAVEIHPAEPATRSSTSPRSAWPSRPTPERGVYRTTRRRRHLGEVCCHVSNTSCGAVDLELNTANPDEIYASHVGAPSASPGRSSAAPPSEGGISTARRNGGDSWHQARRRVCRQGHLRQERPGGDLCRSRSG